jgi:hypothetical protein
MTVLQPSLFDDTLQERFELWLSANPHVYERFRAAALALKAEGRKRFGSKAIWERIRWETMVQTTGSEFKLDNTWTSRMARKLLADCPELVGFLETRRLQRD